MKTPDIIIVDDHKIFRQGLKNLLINEGIANVEAEASNGKEFLEMLNELKSDIVLMDIEMPVMNGIEATKEALKIKPALKILTLTMFSEQEYYKQMINAGAKGFVLKSSGIYELGNAINAIVEGESYFSNELLRNIIINITDPEQSDQKSNSFTLTKREIEVITLVCKGFTNEKIASELNISITTVKGHRSNLLSKTGCKNTASLVIHAIKAGIVKI